MTTTSKMDSSATTGSGALNGLKWLVVLGLLSGGVVGNAYYDDQSLLYRVLALVGVGIVAALVAVQTSQGHAFWELMKASRVEIRKVVWPTRQETTQTTAIVLVLVVIVALILWGLDSSLGWLVSGVIG